MKFRQLISAAVSAGVAFSGTPALIGPTALAVVAAGAELTAPASAEARGHKGGRMALAKGTNTNPTRRKWVPTQKAVKTCGRSSCVTSAQQQLPNGEWVPSPLEGHGRVKGTSVGPVRIILHPNH